MASVAKYAVGMRLRRCEDATAIHFVEQNKTKSFPVKKISSNVLRTPVPQRFLQGRKLIRGLELSLFLGAIALIVWPGDASKWAAAFPSLGEENFIPYAPQESMDTEDFVYFPEEDGNRSMMTGVEQPAYEEGPSPFDEDTLPSAGGEGFLSKSQPEAGLEDADASIVAEGVDPPGDDGLAPEQPLPAAVPGDEVYNNLSENVAELSAAASASEVDKGMPEGLSKNPVSGGDIDEDGQENLTDLLVALSGDEDNEILSDIVTERPVAAPDSAMRGVVGDSFTRLLGLASNFLSNLAAPETEAASVSVASDNLPNKDSVDREGVLKGKDQEAAISESSGSQEEEAVAAALGLHPEDVKGLYEAATLPTHDESALTFNGTSVQSQNKSLSSDSAPSATTTQHVSENPDALPDEEELIEVGLGEVSHGDEDQGAESKSPKETDSRQPGDTNKSQPKRNRTNDITASNAEEEDVTRTRPRTDSLRGTARASSRERLRERKTGPRWKTMLQLAAAFGLATAGAEGGLMYMNSIIDRRERSTRDRLEVPTVGRSAPAEAGKSN